MRSKPTKEERLVEVALRYSARHLSSFSHSAEQEALRCCLSPESWENDYMEATVYDAGIAGSMTMIFLTLATVFLLRSFYKRWKRMDQRRLNDENK
jgi:hypothetical protein